MRPMLYQFPAWSVSILPDCKKVAYNTAKVNTQTSVNVKKPSISVLEWVWRPEYAKDTILLGHGPIFNNSLVEQKAGTNDTSDYFWYMTSVDVKKDDLILISKEVTLRVNSSGHVLHAYVNGKHEGSQWLIARNGDVEIIKNLSSSKWVNKVGLHGEEKQLYSVESRYASRWVEDNLPMDNMMIWYKGTFEAPLGTDSVVVDLQGMNKGHAWVNGKSIGRYWPSFLADEDGCNSTCDYRGPYTDSKCASNCGGPSQRWYHVPHSFFRDGKNLLILFEEMGDNLSQVNFQTIAVGSACGCVYEGKTLELSCQKKGQTISTINFGSFGDPQGTCGSFVKGSCESTNSISAVEQACVGQESCSIEASEEILGTLSHCGSDLTKSLSVEIVC